ncbi:glycosyltransferase family 2 protein [Desertifilum sp. FACHB-1129]|uniref:Glycosyltransferase family 2 protein n=1 Tax=Desertifilum tharense IPPAS B-1220 TaxID=1781255 RepID=A0ACD5GQ91_9CYAN|nr:MULTISPECIES: glycosyltransferase family 2 protein [unclassified Desertifilum]MBD2310985.1 glycosyltransferase family 2 protein [Desertifilum sp. FACHB-1129]MBD2321390.1 glycosyltransferase family 2 protein [Desertifilum sp. FACHB-866]MBD2331303.1 glycosyltransferase family 2 protein [Desertifilum sp. FACHB-868]MDA0208783.1 glycosyltransferase family 2 protein [Cyanobacteria bacterium FC1]
MIQPKVSVVIPTFNRETLVKRAIESALVQTYSNIEVVVVDNCSSDNTYQVVQEYIKSDSRVRCYQNKKNLGPTLNWLRGIELSEGEYVKILFSDDWMVPHAIENFVKPFLESESKIGFSYSSAWLYIANKEPCVCYKQSRHGFTDSLEFLWQYAVWGNIPVSPCMALFRREDLLDFFTLSIPNRFRSDCQQYGIGTDSMLYWKSCEHYSSLYHIPEPLMHLGDSTEQPSFTMNLVRTGKQQILEECYQSAFGYFIATSHLSEETKKLFHTVIFLNGLNSLRPWKLQANIERLDYLFPEGYKWKSFNLTSPRIIPVLGKVLLSRLKI